MLQGQAALAEAQASVERARAYQMMSQAFQDRRLRDSLLNGSGPYYNTSRTIITTQPSTLNINIQKPE